MRTAYKKERQTPTSNPVKFLQLKVNCIQQLNNIYFTVKWFLLRRIFVLTAAQGLFEHKYSHVHWGYNIVRVTHLVCLAVRCPLGIFSMRLCIPLTDSTHTFLCKNNCTSHLDHHESENSEKTSVGYGIKNHPRSYSFLIGRGYV